MTLALIVFAPLAAAAFIALAGGALGRRVIGAIATLALAASFGAALSLAPNLAHAGGKLDAPIARWLPLRGADIHLVLDATMLPVVLMVTGVSTLIALYSIGYLGRDGGAQRYFAALDLFVTSMLLIVTASNLLLLFAGWELVALCSYLLVGHLRDRPAAADAAVKAFVVNRIGDAAFLVGIFAIYADQANVEIASLAPFSAFASALLLAGALAKSAQLPLHTWLPDAMEAPTPVSALIHAATMVSAGVVLLIRLGGVLSPGVLLSAAAVGALTALVAATVALAQVDQRRVLAWSTISQIGLMFVAAGVGAIFAAVFQLISHAFFKAALFLGAGSVLHATDDELDVRRLGGLAPRMRWITVGFAVGALGLAAVPPAAGFFSMEAIAAATVDRPILLVAILATSALSAFYAARLFTLVFVAPAASVPARPLHESPAVMLVPLLALALGTLAFGAAVSAGAIFLGASPEADAPAWLAALSTALALGAAALGIALYRRGPRDERALGPAAAGYGIDRLYRRAIVAPFAALAALLETGAERTNQLLVDAVAALFGWAAVGVRGIQAGYVRGYEALLLAGAAALIAYWSLR